MKKIKLFVSVVTISLLFTGCSGERPPAQDTASSRTEEATAAAPVRESGTSGDIPDEEITVPSYLMGAETDHFQIREEGEASTTYQLTSQQWADAALEVDAQLKESLEQILADKEYYPNITDIAVNEDCSEFDVTFSGPEINIYETTLRMSLYIMGDKIQLYRGEPESGLLTVVNYIDGPTGEIFSTGDSSGLK